MSRIDFLRPEFVEMMPAELEPGVIYVSISRGMKIVSRLYHGEGYYPACLDAIRRIP